MYQSIWFVKVLSSLSRRQESLRVRRVWEQVVVVDEWHVGGGDDFAGEPPPVEGVDGRHGRRDVGALDVDVALAGGLVHHDVEETTVLGALLDDVVAHLGV